MFLRYRTFKKKIKNITNINIRETFVYYKKLLKVVFLYDSVHPINLPILGTHSNIIAPRS